MPKSTAIFFFVFYFRWFFFFSLFGDRMEREEKPSQIKYCKLQIKYFTTSTPPILLYVYDFNVELINRPQVLWMIPDLEPFTNFTLTALVQLQSCMSLLCIFHAQSTLEHKCRLWWGTFRNAFNDFDSCIFHNSWKCINVVFLCAVMSSLWTLFDSINFQWSFRK